MFLRQWEHLYSGETITQTSSIPLQLQGQISHLQVDVRHNCKLIAEQSDEIFGVSQTTWESFPWKQLLSLVHKPISNEYLNPMELPGEKWDWPWAFIFFLSFSFIFFHCSSIFFHFLSFSFIFFFFFFFFFFNFLSLSLMFSHFLSFPVIFSHFLSFSLYFSHFLSISIIFFRFLSFSFNFSQFLSTSFIFFHFLSFSLIFTRFSLILWQNGWQFWASSVSDAFSGRPPYCHAELLLAELI